MCHKAHVPWNSTKGATERVLLMTESAGGITISKTRPCPEQMMKNNSPSIKAYNSASNFNLKTLKNP